ncbi:MAG TPA: hypothetical protein VGE01_08760, partial [Fimbriimonas sp.]
MVAGSGHEGRGLERLRGGVEPLSPAYFALVMATGIVSIATYQLGVPLVPHVLFGINVAAYAILCLLSALRVFWFRRAVFLDLVDHRKGPGFFTWIAAPCVLGSQFVRIYHSFPAAIALWGFAIVLWVLVTYTIFTAFTIKEDKPTLS